MKKPYANNANSDLEVAQALAALIYASSWLKTGRVLQERQGLLLSHRALELLNFMITALNLEDKVEDAQNLVQYETLLANAHMYGVQLAWESLNMVSLSSEEGCKNDST